MSNLLRRLNDLPIFDPNRWPYREFIGRATGTIICVGFLVWRLLDFGRYTGCSFSTFWSDIQSRLGFTTLEPGHIATQIPALNYLWFGVWALETGIYLAYIIAFLTRRPARSVARGFMEVVFPVIIAGLPFFITMGPALLQKIGIPVQVHRGSDTQLLVGGLMMIAGSAINLIGLLTLRRAFTLMAEARTLIGHGIFRYVRHPLYAGHFVVFLGSLLINLYWYTIIVYAVFVLGQYTRARIEERKLTAAFPEYTEYKAKTGMFFPKLW
ncbi:MAG: isoprenylcysteine carboxylmethyltransferase family protein [Candidatus Brocadiia bacterium]